MQTARYIKSETKWFKDSPERVLSETPKHSLEAQVAFTSTS